MHGKTALSGSWDNTLRLWDITCGKALSTLGSHGGVVTAMAISPNGKFALSSSNNNTLKLWDLVSGEVIASFIGDSGIICLAVSPKGEVVLAVENSGYIHFLKLEGV